MTKEATLKAIDKPPEPAPARKEIVAPLNSLTLWEQSNNLWRLVARDATAEDLLQPDFWSVIQERLKSFDRVGVITAKSYHDVLCLYAETGCPVRMKILHTIELPVVAEREHGRVPPGYCIEFDPAQQAYTPRRERDGHPMGRAHGKWHDAYLELLNHAVFRDTAPNAR